MAQGWRTDTYRSLATQNTHVLTIDYRGFGKSTGSPTETGLIIDGVALVNWVLQVAEIPPERIVIVGQSLGTAVASAVGLHFAEGSTSLLPAGISEVQARSQLSIHQAHSDQPPTIFASIILVAPFYSLPSLLLTYHIGGFLPILLPLRPFPRLAHRVTAQMTDKWPTAERLAGYGSAIATAYSEIGTSKRGRGALQLFHAFDDADISHRQTEMICRRLLEDKGAENCPNSPGIFETTEEGMPSLRFEIVSQGGWSAPHVYSSPKPFRLTSSRTQPDCHLFPGNFRGTARL